MSISSQISDRFWNMPQKAQEEIDRERYFIDDIIQKAHIQRLLLENLDGVETAFDGGGDMAAFPSCWRKRAFRSPTLTFPFPCWRPQNGSRRNGA